eukprot:3980624-Pyramimonas_sp.AAC.1
MPSDVVSLARGCIEACSATFFFVLVMRSCDAQPSKVRGACHNASRAGGRWKSEKNNENREKTQQTQTNMRKSSKTRKIVDLASDSGTVYRLPTVYLPSTTSPSTTVYR